MGVPLLWDFLPQTPSCLVIFPCSQPLFLHAVLYMDVDMVLMRDPLPLLRDAPFDVQGLSDFFGPELMPIGGVLNKPCDFYK